MPILDPDELKWFCKYAYYASGQAKIDAQKAFESGACVSHIEFELAYDYSKEDIKKFIEQYTEMLEIFEEAFKPSMSKFSDFSDKSTTEMDVQYLLPKRFMGNNNA